MTFTEEQLKTLSQFEDNFHKAVYAHWGLNPGRANLHTIWEIYTTATGDTRRFNDNCSHCIMALLENCGKAYYKDISELKTRESTTKEVKVSQKSKEVEKKVKIKTRK